MKNSICLHENNRNIFPALAKQLCMFLLVGLTSFVVSDVYAQQRVTINSLSGGPGGDREILFDLMKDWINLRSENVDIHGNGSATNNFGVGDQIHDPLRFLPWHKNYVKSMENYLLDQGYPQFVPLPKYVQVSTLQGGLNIPSEFADLGSGITTSPSFSTSPFTSIAADCANWATTGAFATAVEGYHDPTHGAIGGVMCCTGTAPSTPIFFLSHAYWDDLWYEWESVCTTQYEIAEPSSADYVITGNETWNSSFFTGASPYQVKGKVIITSGAELTIENITMEFLDSDWSDYDGGILVQAGGKLTIDGATLTGIGNLGGTYYGNMWDGITVEGVPTNPSPGPQGLVFVKNNAQITRAKIGILAVNGGRIIARNSTFENNRIDAELRDFNFFSASSFRECSFLSTNELRDSEYHAFCRTHWFNTTEIATDVHVNLVNVRGISLLGNTFVNTIDFAGFGTNPLLSNSSARYDYVFSDPNYSENEERGVGIRSFNSGYRVNPACLDVCSPQPCGLPLVCQNKLGNRFEGLDIGIHAQGTGGPVFIPVIDGNNFANNGGFINCVEGIVLSGVDYANIIENDFEVPADNAERTPVGIFAQGAALLIENNNMTTYQNVAPVTGGNRGIVVENSGTINPSLVNVNTFGRSSGPTNGLYIGTQTQQNNPSLQITCNDYQGLSNFSNIFGIVVSSGSLANQGDITDPAGNRWDNPGCSGDESQISSVSALTYYAHSDADRNPTCISSTVTVVVNGPASSGSCPPVITGCNPACLKVAITGINTQIATLKNLIDGGDQQALLGLINTNAAGLIKKDLLAVSPYLSDVVLKAYLSTPLKGKGAAPAGHVQQIVIANSPVSPGIKGLVDNRNLPSGIQTQIDAAQVGVSGRDQLVRTINRQVTEQQYLAQNGVRQLIADDKILDALNFLKDVAALGVPVDEADIVDLLIALKQFGAAEAVRVQIVNDTDEKVAFKELAEQEIAVKQSGRKFKQMTASEELAVRQVASTNTRCAIRAKCVLEKAYKEKFVRTVAAVALNNNKMGFFEEEDNDPIEQVIPQPRLLRNYPNPFKGTTTIEYYLPENSRMSKVLIHDVITGRIIQSINLSGIGYGKVEVNASNLSAGIYFYRLIVDGVTIDTRNMMIIK